MPFGPNGTFTPPTGAENSAPGGVIRSATWNSINADVATALTQLGQGAYLDIGHSAVKLSHTGDTLETVLATVTVAANTLGSNGVIEIESTYTYSNSASNKTMRIRFGGTSGTPFFNATQTTTDGQRASIYIANAGTVTTQKGWVVSSGGFGALSGTLVASSVDTTSTQTIVFTGQLASSSETISLEAYRVKLIH